MDVFGRKFYGVDGVEQFLFFEWSVVKYPLMYFFLFNR
jgi:hypothetical protein